MDIFYEVYDTDKTLTILERHDFEEAKQAAKEWSERENCEVVVEKVCRETMAIFTKGKLKC